MSGEYWMDNSKIITAHMQHFFIGQNCSGSYLGLKWFPDVQMKWFGFSGFEFMANSNVNLYAKPLAQILYHTGV